MTDEAAATINVVGNYVDGLEVSVSGTPRWTVFEELRATKSALRASPQGLREIGFSPDVPGGPLMLASDGGSKYQFVLRNGAIKRLEVTSRGAVPKVMVQFRASALYEHDLEGAEGIVDALVDPFVQPGYEIKVGRFDAALDFQCVRWRWPEVEDIVCRARKYHVHYDGKGITGMAFGRYRGPMQVVIYDKSLEAKMHRKEWIEGVWVESESYDERLPVFRTELRFGRGVLRDFGVNSVADLRSLRGDLMRYAVGGERPWFRVASTDPRGRGQDRRGSAPWWREVRGNSIEGLPQTGRVRRRGATSVPDLKRARSTMITSAVQTAAWEKVLGRHASDSPAGYLGPVAMEGLPGWLGANGVDSWDQAVSLRATRIAVGREDVVESMSAS